MNATMSPEDRAELRKMLDEMDAAGEPAGDDKYEALCAKVDFLVEDNKLLRDEVNMLRQAVLDEFDGLYGGVQSLYDGEQKKIGVEELRSKYGSRPEFQEFDKVKQHFDEEKDVDLFDKLYDMRKDFRDKSEDKDNFDGEGFVEQFAQQLAELINKAKEDGTIPKDAEVEVKIEQEGEPEELDPILKENIEKYKKTAMGRRL